MSIHNHVAGTKPACDQLTELDLSPNRRRDVRAPTARACVRVWDPDEGSVRRSGSDVGCDWQDDV